MEGKSSQPLLATFSNTREAKEGEDIKPFEIFTMPVINFDSKIVLKLKVFNVSTMHITGYNPLLMGKLNIIYIE